MAEKIIEFDRVVAGYSPSLTILNETTLDARKGEITLLIGPNGAGKSTLLKTLFGFLTPRSGEVRFEGRRINGKPPHELLAEGLAYVPQGRNLFPSLTVRHNLELGGFTLPRAEVPARIDEVLQRFPRIRERLDNQASTMSGGASKTSAASVTSGASLASAASASGGASTAASASASASASAAASSETTSADESSSTASASASASPTD